MQRKGSDVTTSGGWFSVLAAMGVVGLVLASAAAAAPSRYFDQTFTFTEDTGIVCGSG
jgi:hypothetical protein